MAYEKTNWTSTTPINTTSLNKIESAIEQNSNDIEQNRSAIETNNTNLNEKIGDLTTLNTTEKSSLVDAINSVVESGSNDNGDWIKYADGTMICGKHLSGKSSSSIWASPIYYQDVDNGDWANEFVSIQNVQVSSTGIQFWASIGDYTNTSAGKTRLMRPDGNSTNYNINILAIGTWK